ncbi:hypothetical protein QBZ16_001527 [Prototheca wickerhamii]|uniref:Uncharacterized protein n=1 Tax=Prototheca wickerhamii TaxID=3111 RepID=A0AAD9ID66_PROWI|nr:hypothetical protein QBZ16_001527 [Prototheca wickerhamii]
MRLFNAGCILARIVSFLDASHIQPSWARAQSAVESMGLSGQLNKQDLDAIVAICPISFTIHVHHRLRNEDDVPAWTGTVAPDILAASLRRTQELEELQDVAPHPLQIRTDGAGTVTAADQEGDEGGLVLNILDPGARATRGGVPAAFRARLDALAADPAAEGLPSDQVPARPSKRSNKMQRVAWALWCCLAQCGALAQQRRPPKETPADLQDSNAGPAVRQDAATLAHLPPDLSTSELVAAARTLRRDGDLRATRLQRKRGAPRTTPAVVRVREGCSDRSPLDPDALLEHLKQLDWYQGQVSHTERVPARVARYADAQVAGRVQKALESLGIRRLFCHQAEAVASLRAGTDTVVATSTASGKSLCYNIPILEALAADPGATALYMFPTKALAQASGDGCCEEALRELCGVAFGDQSVPSVDIYDGDTARSERDEVRARARLLITNPDMLHTSILPFHQQFQRILAGLRYVVVDEAHVYRGVFGAHTAMVIRRLRRLCSRIYNSSPVFALTTATIANPREQAARLLASARLHVVTEDGSPHGPKTFVLWNPPLAADDKQVPNPIQSSKRAREESARHTKRAINQQRFADTPPIPSSADWARYGPPAARYGATGVGASERRRSPIMELSCLLAECVQHGLQTIAFCGTRKLCELVVAYVRELLARSAPGLGELVAVYRAGYSPAERRGLERALHDGRLRAVAATNALELGLDVGALDATLHLGFPGSVSSLLQQAGRAGRRERPSLSLMVAWDGALDQHFVGRPDRLFGGAVERAVVDVANAAVLEAHAACAALETPLVLCSGMDLDLFGPVFFEGAEREGRLGLLARHPAAAPGEPVLHYAGRAPHPASKISLRAIDPDRFAILDEARGGAVLEEIEQSKAFYEVYDGAVYMHQGRTYICKKLDLDGRVAIVRPADLKYYTALSDFTTVHVVGGRPAFGRDGCLDNDDVDGTQGASLINDDAHTLSSSPITAPAPNASPAPLRVAATFAGATVSVRFLGFTRIWRGSGIAFDKVALFLPDVEYETETAYVRLPPCVRRAVRDAGLEFRAAVHAAAHAVLNVLPLFILCNANDVGTGAEPGCARWECDSPYDTRYKPERLLIYDKYPGGIGLAAAAAPQFGPILAQARDLVRDCPCATPAGCPCCVQHTHCGEYNTVISKPGALVVLEELIRWELARTGAEVV